MLHGSYRPLDRFTSRNERCAEEDEYAQIDSIVAKELRRSIKSRDIESLVELLESGGMNCLQTNRNFESSRNSASEFHGTPADEMLS